MARVNLIPGSQPMLTGEGPHWMEKDKALVYLDIPGGKFHRYFPDTGRHQMMIPDDIGKGSFTSLIIPVEGKEGDFIGSVGSSLVLFNWPTSDKDEVTKAPTHLCTVEEGNNVRFNDGKCDPKGRLWAGTMAYETEPAKLELEQGKLFSFDSDLKARKWVDKISISNGIAFSNCNDHMYYIDSLAYSVDAFQYDNETGAISNRHVVLDYKAAGLKNDIPDGMAVDSQENLWVANYNGHKIICIDPVAGKIIRTIDLPVRNPTSVCWGGADYSSLYVTSSSIGLTSEEINAKPDSGKCFEITGLGVKGLPPVEFRYKK